MLSPLNGGAGSSPALGTTIINYIAESSNDRTVAFKRVWHIDNIEPIKYTILVKVKRSIRHFNKNRFNRCIELRKQGLSYGEIRNKIPVAKSTLQNWLEFAGLTLTRKHLQIQLAKRVQNRQAGTEASRLTRQKKDKELNNQFLAQHSAWLDDPMFIGGCMLYEAEGSKKDECRFSNSDNKVIKFFVRFLEQYFGKDRINDLGYRLFVHENRKDDLPRIRAFWIDELHIPEDKLALTWKRNKAKKRRNINYVGQLLVRVVKGGIVRKNIQAVCQKFLD